MGHYRLPTVGLINAVSVATFNQFILLWFQCCDLIRREQASSKVWSKDHAPFVAYWHVKIVAHYVVLYKVLEIKFIDKQLQEA